MGWGTLFTALAGTVSFFCLAQPRLALADDGIAEPATLESVIAYVRAHPELRTIDEFLARLPASWRSQYTLMHASNSLQAATPELPRAILFGPDARLLLAFSGDPKTTRYDSLEMIGFHDDTATFEMREIVFPENDAHKTAAEISQANPPLCLTCHRADPRPNWEHYNSWPGAFGSNDDEFPNDAEVSSARLRSFLDKADSLPRYRHLIEVKAGYGNGEGFRTPVTHNINFTERVAALNFLRVARLARATPRWSAYKFATLGAMWCGSSLADFIPESERAAWRNAIDKLKGSSYGVADAIRWPFEARGMSVDDWYLDFVSTGASASFGTPGWPYWEITGPLVEGDQDLLEFFSIGPQEYEGAHFTKGELKGSCEAMAKRSQAALAAGGA